MLKKTGSYMLEIIVLITIIIVSYSLSTNLNNKLESDLIIDNSLAIKVIENNSDVIYQMSDEYAKDNADDTILSIYNYNNQGINCKLLMKLKKYDNLNYEALKIKVDSDIFNLSSKYVYEDNEYLYFDLAHREITDEKNVSFAMWLDENIDEFDSNIEYNFSVERV